MTLDMDFHLQLKNNMLFKKEKEIKEKENYFRKTKSCIWGQKYSQYNTWLSE